MGCWLLLTLVALEVVIDVPGGRVIALAAMLVSIGAAPIVSRWLMIETARAVRSARWRLPRPRPTPESARPPRDRAVHDRPGE